MATEETLRLIIESRQRGDAAKREASDLDKLRKAVQTAAVGFASLKTAQAAVDFARWGGQVDRQVRSLDNLASAAGTTGGEIVKAMQRASDFTIDRMTAMESANKAMLLQVAQSPEEFERLTRVATTLGRAMGQDAAKSIDDFVVAAGRQSKQIADNLGLMVSAEVANEKYAKSLGITADELTDTQRKQAFLTEMLVQGEEKTKNLTDAQEGLATKLERVESVARTLGSYIAEEFAGQIATAIAPLTDTTEGLENLEAIGIRLGRILSALFGVPLFTQIIGTAADVAESRERVKNMDALLYEHITGVRGLIKSEWGEAWEDYIDAVDQIEDGSWYVAAATKRSEDGLISEALAIRRSEQAYYDYIDAGGELAEQMWDTPEAVEAAARAWEEYKDKVGEAAEATVAAKEAQLDFGTAYSEFIRDSEKTEADFAERREQIEQKHQEKINELVRRGQARRIRIDEAAEWDKLATLEDNLGVMLQRQGEFTDKTAQSTRMAKDLQIKRTQEQIEGQKKLLDDYYNGRLVRAGENVEGLLAEEQARYDEELRMLEESRTEQEEEQQRSLGRMLIQHLTAYAQMAGYSQETIFNMQLEISQQYGIVTEAGVQAARDSWAEWDAKLKLMEAGVQEFAQRTKEHLASIPKTVDIRIRTIHERIGEESPGAAIPEIEMQGGGFTAFRRVLAGEAGPELARLPDRRYYLLGRGGPGLYNLPRGTRIRTAAETRQILRSMTIGSNNSYTYNLADATAMRVLEEQRRLRDRRYLSRTM